MFDVIGDIHGQGDALIALLQELGYQREGRAYRHPDRKVIFVGDFVDRGPKIQLVLETVRAMVDAGTALAVMGNHEFNMIAYHTHDGHDGHLRPHTPKNNKQAQATLDQLSAAARSEWVEWFRDLPMWLDAGGLRVVHACWNQEQIDVITRHRQALGGCSDAFMAKATNSEGASELYQAIEVVLKGPEAELPDGMAIRDKEQRAHRNMRTKWFVDASKANVTWRDYAFYFDEAALAHVPDTPLPEHLRHAGYPREEPPVIFGHYWVPGEPSRKEPLAHNVACVDLSAAKKGGLLCAYRWDGERQLSSSKFVTVAAS